MLWPQIASIHDRKACRVERSKQCRSWPQAQVLRQVRKDQPALAPSLQVRGSEPRNLRKHATADRLAPGVRTRRVVTWLSPQPPQPIEEALPAIFNRIATHDPSP